MIHRHAGSLLFFAFASCLACGDSSDEDTDTQALEPAPAQGAAAPSTAAPNAAAAEQPPAVDTVAPEIPGVVAEGTPVEVIAEGFDGTEGPLPLPDLSLIFTETTANRITRIAADDSLSTYLENSNGSNALAFDPEGRLVSVQTTPDSR